MWNKRLQCVGFFVLTLAWLPGSVNANLIVNGSFESPATAPGQTRGTELGTLWFAAGGWGNEDIDGWNRTERIWHVTDGGTGLIPDGSYAESLDASYDHGGIDVLSQEGLKLTAGMPYRLSFYAWGESGNPRIDVDLSGADAISLLDDYETDWTDGVAELIEVKFVLSVTGEYTIEFRGDRYDGANVHFHAWIDDVRLVVDLPIADSPSPGNEADDVSRDVVLGWRPGAPAIVEHNVYFSTRFADVNEGTAQVAEGLADPTYDPGRLAFGTQYFWRVDEVNAAPDSRVFTGEVWSFTVEPASLPLVGITAAASSFTGQQDPNNTVNGSGLDENDGHSDLVETMWLTEVGDTAPSIQFAFDRVEKLDKIHVWNHNSQTEAILGFGIKEALIETSLEGETWTELKAVVLPQATGQSDYTGADVFLDGVVARYIRIIPQSNYSILGLTQYGLSEVRFYYIPTRAWELSPADGETTETAEVPLSWRAGREAAQHEVYLGTDSAALGLLGTTSDNAYVADTLDYAMTYYWQVVEVNEAETPDRYESDVLSFNTPDYAVVDDMEMYKAEEGLFIWEHWVDGFENPDENGAVVGNGDEAEMAIVHGGAQSMPMQYNNSLAAVSEATLQIDNENWLGGGIQTLSLYFHGAADNSGQLYVKINDAKVDYEGDVDDLTQGPWRPWNIDLSTVGGDLTKVTSLTIGVSGGGATGTLYIDDIRLYPVLGERITPVEPDAASLLAHYTFDGDFSDSAGNNDGTALGDVKIVTDSTRGQVLSLDGDDDAVAVPLLPASEEVTISMWVNPLDAITPSDMKSTYAGDGWTEGDIHWRIANNRIDGGISGLADGTNMTGAGVVPYEQWSLVVLTMSPTAFSYWLNGIHDITRVLETGPTLQLGEGLIGAWLNGDLLEREWAGLIDDVRIYNRALSEGEVLWLAGKTNPIDRPL